MYFADDEHRWLSPKADVEIVAGPEAPAQLPHYCRIRDGKPTGGLDYHSDRIHYTDLDDKDFQKVMADEDAVLYRFTVTNSFGNR